MTAAHIPDWIKNGHTGESKAFRSDKPILRACYQLACRGKHFHLNGKQHDSVEASEKIRYVEGDYVEEDCFDEPLLITLTGNLAEKLGVSNLATVLVIAEIAVSFWRTWLEPEGG